MAVTLVQTAFGSLSNMSLSAVSTAYKSNVAAGNLLCVLAEYQGPTRTLTTMSISDTLANAWTPVFGAIQNPAASIPVFIQGWFCLSKASGANTVSISSDAANQGFNSCSVGEFSGFSGTAILDVMGVNTSGVSTAVPPITLVTTRANAAIFGFALDNSGTATALTPNSPFLVGDGFLADSMEIMYASVASKGTYNFGGTWTDATPASPGVSAAFSVSNGNPDVGGNGGSWLTVNLNNSLRGLRH